MKKFKEKMNKENDYFSIKEVLYSKDPKANTSSEWYKHLDYPSRVAILVATSEDKISKIYYNWYIFDVKMAATNVDDFILGDTPIEIVSHEVAD